MMHRVFCILFLIIICADLPAQNNYVYTQYTQTDGLPSHTILDVKQDYDGFIWIATSNGVSRYDGRNFVNYFVENGLPDNDINQLFIDRNNRIWMLPFANTICYYKNGKIYNQKNDSALKKIKIDAMPLSMATDGDGNLAINTDQQVIFLDKKIRMLTTYNKDKQTFLGIGNNEANQIVFNIHSSASPEYTDEYRYQNKLGLIKKEGQPITNHNSNVSVYDSVLNLSEKDDKIYIKDIVANENWKVKKISNIVTTSRLNQSVISFNTSHGTYLYDYHQKKYVDSFLNHIYINRCMIDRDGSFWFATPADGLFFLSNRSVQEIADTRNKNGGIYRFAYQNNLLYFLNFANQIKGIDIQSRSIIQDIQAIDSNSRSMKFITTLQQNILYQNGRQLNAISNNKSENILEFASIKSVSGSNTNALIATSSGVSTWNLIEKKQLKTIWEKRGNSAIQIGDKYYIGDLSGLYVLDKNLKETFLGNTIPVLQTKITQIAEGPDHTIWVGTAGIGIVCIKNDKLVEHFTEIDGLRGNNCNRIKTYGDSVWVGTDKGISLALFQNGRFIIEKQGLPFGLNPVSVYDIEVIGDKIFSATSQGIQLYENKNNNSKYSCRLMFTKIQSLNSSWPIDAKSITLKPGEKNLIVSFTAISFTGSDITYFYKTDVSSDTWFKTSDESLEFPNIFPGKYELSIYAVSNTGIKSNVIVLNMAIEKPWYQQTGIILLFVALSLFAIASFLYYRIKRSNQKAKAEADRKLLIASLEQKALRSQMNPHFIFNCLNAIKDFIYLNDIEKAEDFISRFSKLIRDTLYLSSQKRITVHQELSYLKNYLHLEEIRFNKQFATLLLHQHIHDEEDIFLPPLLLQPIIENSIRHGLRHLTTRKGLLKIVFEMKGDRLCCTIEDNGIGRNASSMINKQHYSTHESKGVELIQERIRSHNTVFNDAINFYIEDIIIDEVICGTKSIFIFKQSLI